MTQEEKELLLKDLCGRLRLPYGLYGQFDIPSEKSKFERVLVVEDICGIFSGVCLFKPYLRPMSSMTEEERCEYEATKDTYGYYECHLYDSLESFDWLNSHHFDYRRLIEKGLALEAPEGMYKTE
jgi:hypothetical protein